MDTMEDYLKKNLEYSEVMLYLIELIMMMKKEGSAVSTEKLEPDDLKEETDRELWGLEVSVRLLLGEEGYAMNEVFLFNNIQERDNLAEYIDYFASS